MKGQNTSSPVEPQDLKLRSRTFYRCAATFTPGMKTPMRIVEFAFVVYPVTDLARSRAFYEDVLGLTSTAFVQQGDQFWVEYEIGPHTLGIGNEPFLKPSGDGPHLALEVDDFDKTIEHLKRHQVPFAVEPFNMPRCRAAIVMDPDGNKLGIHKRSIN